MGHSMCLWPKYVCTCFYLFILDLKKIRMDRCARFHEKKLMVQQASKQAVRAHGRIILRDITKGSSQRDKLQLSQRDQANTCITQGRWLSSAVLDLIPSPPPPPPPSPSRTSSLLPLPVTVASKLEGSVFIVNHSCSLLQFLALFLYRTTCHNVLYQ